MAGNISLIFKYLKLNITKVMQYKTSFIMQIVMMILNNAFFIFQWIVIFNITDSINGYGFNEVMLLWGLTAGSYGVAHLFFNGAFSIGDLVYEGKIDVYLTQPKNVLINICSSSSSISAIGDIIYCFLMLIIAKAAWWWYLAAIPIIIIGGLIYTSIIVCFQTISFYAKQGNSVADIISTGIINFANYPIGIFNDFIKFLMFTIIPCGFMVFVPVQYIFLSFNIYWVLGLIAFTIFVMFLAFFLFNRGLKKYSSSNLMTGRL